MMKYIARSCLHNIKLQEVAGADGGTPLSYLDVGKITVTTLNEIFSVNSFTLEEVAILEWTQCLYSKPEKTG